MSPPPRPPTRGPGHVLCLEDPSHLGGRRPLRAAGEHGLGKLSRGRPSLRSTVARGFRALRATSQPGRGRAPALEFDPKAAPAPRPSGPAGRGSRRGAGVGGGQKQHLVEVGVTGVWVGRAGLLSSGKETWCCVGPQLTPIPGPAPTVGPSIQAMSKSTGSFSRPCTVERGWSCPAHEGRSPGRATHHPRATGRPVRTRRPRLPPRLAPCSPTHTISTPHRPTPAGPQL